MILMLSNTQNIDKVTERLSVMTVCSPDLHNGGRAHTGKALANSPKWNGVVIQRNMTKSTSESNIKEKPGAINWFEEEHEFISDEVFATQDFCSFKCVYLNRPCQKP